MQKGSRTQDTVKVMPLPTALASSSSSAFAQPLGNACGRHSTLAMLSFFILRSAPEKFVYVEKSNIPSRTRIIIIISSSSSSIIIIIIINIIISHSNFRLSILMLAADPAIRPSVKRAQLLKTDGPRPGQDQAARH
ncbi:hypothetical protein AWZ03_002979 [Drosophila navojoa]|uniref:Uncharacterized protein n=1 Tax=Drosophila navojoa TaxID=7232 RepID=A0A484BS60_DRONA|nr:hypothetical protein AWZ03_002979 [Drosophila navojoa]